MIELILWMSLCTDPIPRFFDGYLPLPNPKPEDEIIIIIPRLDKEDFNSDPIKRA